MELSPPQRFMRPPGIIPQAFPPFTSIVANHGAKKRAEPKGSGGHRRHRAQRGIPKYASVG
jgi:hypothetical protein